mmetsp:Transcript_9554/g.12827  ORF Transcript_9554/g.12827 Transcript_9554/m.12827 type:complete len:201 (-) Transcript_9554:195-797(-)
MLYVIIGSIGRDDSDAHSRACVRWTGHHELLSTDCDGELLTCAYSSGNFNRVGWPSISIQFPRTSDALRVGHRWRRALLATWSTWSASSSRSRTLIRRVYGDGDLKTLSWSGIVRTTHPYDTHACIHLEFFPRTNVFGHSHAKYGCLPSHRDGAWSRHYLHTLAYRNTISLTSILFLRRLCVFFIVIPAAPSGSTFFSIG